MAQECSTLANINPDGVKQLSGKELFPQLEALSDSLTQSQYEAAKLFEIAYYSISNFAELAREVRFSAHQARTSHEFASALMKKFAMTGNQIVETVIPLILESIDIGENAVVKAYFNMIIEWSEEMKTEAENTRDKYIELTRKLQSDIELIRKKREDDVQEKKNVDEAKKYQEKLKQTEEEQLRKWEAEKQQNDRELNELRNTRQTVTQELHEGSNKGKTYMYVALVPVIGWAAAGIGIWRDKKNFEKKVQLLQSTQAALSAADKKNYEIMKEELDAQKRKQERMFMIQQLYLKDELLGDESSLLEAVQRLGEADRHLDKLSRFWGDMAVLLKYLRNETVAGQPFLESIENPACATAFKRTLGKANEKWVRFGEVCTQYVYRCEHDPKLSINSLYGFLDGRVDRMNKDERGDQIRAIQHEFQQLYAIEGAPEEDDEDST